MKLTVRKREKLTKSETAKIRREGDIPAVLYGQGAENEMAVVQGEEFRAILRNMPAGLLSTTRFELHDGKHVRHAIIKDIQYHRTTYAVEHLDLMLLDEKKEVTVQVPLRITGVDECVGIKLGGFQRNVKRMLKVRCLPKDIPHGLSLDIRNLNINESKRLSDVELPNNVRPLAKMSEVAVVIAKR